MWAVGLSTVVVCEGHFAFRALLPPYSHASCSSSVFPCFLFSTRFASKLNFGAAPRPRFGPVRLNAPRTAPRVEAGFRGYALRFGAMLHPVYSGAQPLGGCWGCHRIFFLKKNDPG